MQVEQQSAFLSLVESCRPAVRVSMSRIDRHLEGSEIRECNGQQYQVIESQFDSSKMEISKRRTWFLRLMLDETSGQTPLRVAGQSKGIVDTCPRK